MNTIQLKFHFEHETNQQTARDVLNIMTDYGLVIDKLGFYEPINTPFTNETFLSMWMDGLDGHFLFYGSLKQRKSSMAFHTRGEGLPGSFYVAVNLSEAHFHERPDEWVLFFKALCDALTPYRAFIAKETVTHYMYEYEKDEAIFLKPDEVEWYNYWSGDVFKHSTLESVKRFDWASIEKTSSGLYCQLIKDIRDDNYIFRAEQARAGLGEGLLLKRNLDPELLYELNYQATLHGIELERHTIVSFIKHIKYQPLKSYEEIVSAFLLFINRHGKRHN